MWTERVRRALLFERIGIGFKRTVSASSNFRVGMAFASFVVARRRGGRREHATCK
jgi:hypothetical protein